MDKPLVVLSFGAAVLMSFAWVGHITARCEAMYGDGARVSLGLKRSPSVPYCRLMDGSIKPLK